MKCEDNKTIRHSALFPLSVCVQSSCCCPQANKSRRIEIDKRRGEENECVFAESWEGATKSELAAIGREAEVR